MLCHLVFPESQGVPSTLSQKDKVSRPVLPAPPPRSQQLPQLVGVLHSIRVCSASLAAVAGPMLQPLKSLAAVQRAALAALR